ncbi:MAG: hypothetical protein V7672_14875 [Brevundimonas sp.]|uniref:hypothetical protein n=1 Tax=Brevundimonas sp. TaxID=1871086 RepID=UPI0030039E81
MTEIRLRNERVEHLERVIYNTPKQYGLGAQLLAIDELKSYRKRKAVILELAEVLREEYAQQNAPVQLRAVEALIRDLRS